jgi:hypothetical protein
MTSPFLVWGNSRPSPRTRDHDDRIDCIFIVLFILLVNVFVSRELRGQEGMVQYILKSFTKVCYAVLVVHVAKSQMQSAAIPCPLRSGASKEQGCLG